MLRGVYPERGIKGILRSAQNDMRRAQHDNFAFFIKLLGSDNGRRGGAPQVPNNFAGPLPEAGPEPEKQETLREEERHAGPFGAHPLCPDQEARHKTRPR